MEKIGYARCSTCSQDLTAQRKALIDLGAQEDRIYTDHGLTGTNRKRPGLELALAAVRQGDTPMTASIFPACFSSVHPGKAPVCLKPPSKR